jgi:two-component system, oxyanion-binding sensor
MNDQTKDKQREGMSRRAFIKAGGALLGGVALGGRAGALRASAHAGGSIGLEKTRLSLGFIPLTDCAPLVMAQEKGYFARYGLDVALSKEASWANIRDKVSIGALDGGHMLAGMPIAATLGVGAMRKPTVTAFSMDLNGNAITVSNALYERMLEADPEAMAERPTSARALKKVIEADKAAGRPPMTFAAVFPVSTHYYELTYWMAAAGIDPVQDVRIIIIPPPQMVANLRARNVDGYCVGEPWNMRAVDAGIGRVLISNHEIWNNNPEKVLGLNEEWVEQNPNTHKALVMALIETNRWMDQPENRMEVVRTISRRAYVNAPEDVVKMSMTGTLNYARDEDPAPMPDFNVFYRYAATFPWRSHAEWFITQMLRWGQVEEAVGIKEIATRVYRTDLYREAAEALGIAHPTVDHKKEGVNAEPWVLTNATQPIDMGPDMFFDGKVFDPERLMAYMVGFDVKHMKVAMDDLARVNA